MIKPTFLVFLSLPFWGCTPQAKPESKTPSPPGQSTASTLTTSQSPTVINTAVCPNTAVSTITGWILPSTTDTPCPEPTPYEKEWMREDPTVKDCFKEAHCTKYIKKLNQKMIGKWKLEEYLDSHDGNGYSHNWQKAEKLFTLEFTPEQQVIYKSISSCQTWTLRLAETRKFLTVSSTLECQSIHGKIPFYYRFQIDKDCLILIATPIGSNLEYHASKYQRIIP